MIRVKYVGDKSSFKLLEVKGHANSTTVEGHDIVCAGVSACVVGALNALENPKQFNLLVEDGHVIIENKDDIQLSSHNLVVLHTLIVQLQTIEETYKKFIKIN